MAGPIRVDLEAAQQCKAIDMIEFLFAFCLSEDGKTAPVRDKKPLKQAFERVKEVANRRDTTLHTELSKV